MSCYMTIDVGGTQIKASLTNEYGESLLDQYLVCSAKADRSETEILENFRGIFIQLADMAKEPVEGIAFAFPGEFDYPAGICKIKGLDKYEALYNVNLKSEFQKIITEETLCKAFAEDGKVPMLFINDVEAFGLGAAEPQGKVFAVAIGTGAGAAFLKDGRPAPKGADGVPENGCIYDVPFHGEILDDWISKRGLQKLARKKTGIPLEGKELAKGCEQGNPQALEIFEEFGILMAEALEPFIRDFGPDELLLGGQIMKSWRYFSGNLEKLCSKYQVKIKVETDSSKAVYRGLAKALGRERNMKITGKYHNYELHPVKQICGYEEQAFEGYDSIREKLREQIEHLKKKKKQVIVTMDCYPGVDMQEILQIARELEPDRIIDMEDLAKEEAVLEKEFADYITDDRVFGVICHKKLQDFFEPEKLSLAQNGLNNEKDQVIVIAGVGAGLVSPGDIYIYCNITRWEIQLRYRAGMPNWHSTNFDAPVLAKYKRGFFIEWRLADQYKNQRYEKMDFLLETEKKGRPKMLTGEAFREGLKQMVRAPFRMEPYFDPGVWGGHWMQENFGLDKDSPNFAWSFDGVPEENCVNLQYGKVTVKIPAMDIVQYCPHQLLGERVHGRFGAEFPIRFDLLDTMGGGNLSLQVHPLTEYIQNTFGMHYTQDESYYLLDADEDSETYVYLGVKKDVDKEEMFRELEEAQQGGKEFPAEKYVNKVPVKKHDHILIPAGTIHCSGKNTMVLEISATPYIFTFKLWDWGRVGLDGIPRPVHLEHGKKNVQWERDTEWIYENLVGQQKTVEEGNGYQLEKTGLHSREFIDTYRYTLTAPKEVVMNDSVNMINLVDGSSVKVESTDGSFAPFLLHYAETAVIPATVGKYRFVPADPGEEVKIVVASVR